jgi:hypothetical protein
MPMRRAVRPHTHGPITIQRLEFRSPGWSPGLRFVHTIRTIGAQAVRLRRTTGLRPRYALTRFASPTARVRSLTARIGPPTAPDGAARPTA